jgi:hypothetical protein
MIEELADEYASKGLITTITANPEKIFGLPPIFRAAG